MLNISHGKLAEKIVGYLENEEICINELQLKRVKIDIQKMIVDASCGLTYKAFFDGGSTPNPGQMKIGGYIEEPNGKRIYEYSTNIGYGTNNEAEYSSLLHVCKELVFREILQVRIHGDSSLVVNQVTGVYKAKHAKMVQLRDEVREVLKKVNQWEIVHIPRLQNKKADALT